MQSAKKIRRTFYFTEKDLKALRQLYSLYLVAGNSRSYSAIVTEAIHTYLNQLKGKR